MKQGVRNYFVITGGYWGFTITDGAIRMLVVLYFHQIGYSPFEIASLFLFYEFFGIVTNLTGGWLGSRIGLNRTMHIGMLLQVLALGMLTVPDSWLTIAYVMFAQALSGIAKDLNKMSAKASVKLMLADAEEPEDTENKGDNRLFKWVAALTGSKNTLKGAGFFIGAVLLGWIGFQGALAFLSLGLFMIFIITWLLLPKEIGKTRFKPKFKHLFSKSKDINYLSAARFFLFGARDVWFVVALPVYLGSVLGWQHAEVGGFFALWIIVYGLVQAFAPNLVNIICHGCKANATTSRNSLFILAVIPALIALMLHQSDNPGFVILFGLTLFGIIFAVNSALHSFLILFYSDHEKVALNVGFYYMANAGGRLLGTILSGWGYQIWGLSGCLWVSSGFILVAGILSFSLSNKDRENVSMTSP